MIGNASIAADASASNALHPETGRAVFLLPGVYGDEPKLLELRKHLAGRIRLVTIALPDLDSPIPILSSIPETAGSIVQEILIRQKYGEIYLVGFSFGASLALETAAQLQRADRSVAYLGLIDGPLKPTDLRRPYLQMARSSITPRGALFFAKRVLHRLNEKRKVFAIRKNLTSIKEDDGAQRRAVLLHLRSIALNTWEPPECDAPGLIIFSAILFKNAKRWRELCKNCQQVHIMSDHENIIQGESLHLVASALADNFAELCPLSLTHVD